MNASAPLFHYYFISGLVHQKGVTASWCGAVVSGRVLQDADARGYLRWRASGGALATAKTKKRAHVLSVTDMAPYTKQQYDSYTGWRDDITDVAYSK